MKCGEMLRKLRKQKGLTTYQVADQLNVTQATISRYENSLQEPSLNLLCDFADFYGVSLDYLLKGEENGIIITVEEYKILMQIKSVLTNLENRYENLNKSINIQADNNSGTIIVGNHNNVGDKNDDKE